MVLYHTSEFKSGIVQIVYAEEIKLGGSNRQLPWK